MFNKQMTKEEYEQRMASFDFCNTDHMDAARAHFEQLKANHPRKELTGNQNESVSGDYIYKSKDCSECYNIRECRDCKYCDTLRDSRDCMDHYVWGNNAERVYDSQCCGFNVQNIRFCNSTFEGTHSMTYCYYCTLGSNNCFGCSGLKKAEYCILNKQYTKEEYETLIPRIIEHMTKTGEWGGFFPASISPHGYNETKAQERFPIKKEEATDRGWKWRDELPYTEGQETISWDQVPYAIDDVPDSICDEILACNRTGRNYRIPKQELMFYRNIKLPIPRIHFEERHKDRMAMRNPSRLWKRPCSKCSKEIQTSYAPERPEKVYCEECYLKEVY